MTVSVLYQKVDPASEQEGHRQSRQQGDDGERRAEPRGHTAKDRRALDSDHRKRSDGHDEQSNGRDDAPAGGSTSARVCCHRAAFLGPFIASPCPCG